MSDDIQIETLVVGGEAIKKHLQDFGSELRARMRIALAQAGRDLAAEGEARAPKGPTGDLKASLRAKLNETNNQLSESVRPTDFKANWIIGGTGPGTESVTRLVKGRDVQERIAAHVRMKNGVAVGIARARRSITKGTVTYERPFHTKANPFMAQTYDALIGSIQASLARVVGETLAEANQ